MTNLFEIINKISFLILANKGYKNVFFELTIT